MKLPILVGIFLFLSCFDQSRNLKTVSYPIPSGRKVLFIPDTPSSFSDSYSEDRELSLRILEELEEFGFLVILGESIWEEPVQSLRFSDRLETFQNQMKEVSKNETPRIQIWKNRAESMGATDIFLLRHSVHHDSKTKWVRIFWINLSKKDIIRFDWNWDFKNPMPLREKLFQISGEKQ